MRKVIFYCYIVLSLSILSGCRSGSTPKEEKEIPIGKVAIISNGQEYAPFENWIYTLDGFAADGMRLRPEDVNEKLTEIDVSDDFEIVVEGVFTGEASYVLYNNNFEEVYRNSTFKIPTESGPYILYIELAWGTRERYSGYQYFFKINK